MCLVSGKNVSSNPMEKVSEEIKMFVLKHHRGHGKEEMMKTFPDVKENRFEMPKFQVEEVVPQSPKEARETQEESEETSKESGSIS